MLLSSLRLLLRSGRSPYRLTIRTFTQSAPSPSQRYKALIQSFTLKPDERQQIVVAELDRLYHALRSYTPPKLPAEADSLTQSMGTFDVTPSTVGSYLASDASLSGAHLAAPSASKGLFSRLFGSAKDSADSESTTPKPKPKIATPTLHNVKVPNGLYIYGGTGTGKTMLMDLFFESIDFQTKQRVHFAKFMLEVHDAIHQHTQRLKASGLSPHEMRGKDPVPAISLDIAKKSTVLCFDEFQVTDIVDAVLLNRLFTSLWHLGIVCVATSNREPDMLYLNGLQRQQVFLPFLKLLEAKMDVIDLNSIDYRDHGSNLKGVYFIGENERAQFETAWERVVEGDGAKHSEHAQTIPVMAGRELSCPRSVGHSKATRFTFSELCDANLGSADYLALSKHFGTVFIDSVPHFGFMNRNTMKRFILLIDELYNSKNRVVCLAVAEPEKLLEVEMTKEERGQRKDVYEDIFQFDRCSSRLMEMQSQEYLDDFKMLWRDQESAHVD